MTAIRWFALLPDSMTGKDVPIPGPDGKPREWLAADKDSARELVKATLTPNQFRIALVMSVLEYEASEADARVKKLAEDKAQFYKMAARRKHG